MIGEIFVWYWPVISDLLILRVPVRAIALRFMKRDTLSRGVRGVAVDVAPVPLVTELLLFLGCQFLHTFHVTACAQQSSI
jgi:hypothetical protein